MVANNFFLKFASTNKNLQFMEAVSEKSNYEIERGKPMPGKNHSLIQRNIIVTLVINYGKDYEVMPEIKIKGQSTDLVPDVALYQQVAFTPGNDEIKMTTPPLCAIEILSPKQSLSDLITKANSYFALGAMSCWLVIPDLSSIYVFKKPMDFEIFSKKDILKDLNIILKQLMK